MTSLQEMRRREFAIRNKGGKENYIGCSIVCKNGINCRYQVDSMSSSKMEGSASLFYNVKFARFNTDGAEEDFIINVASHKDKRIMIDVVSRSLQGSFDIGFKHDNSSGFMFSAYFHTDLEEYLYVINALASDSDVKRSCIRLFTVSEKSRELLEAYNLVSAGIQQHYKNQLNTCTQDVERGWQK